MKIAFIGGGNMAGALIGGLTGKGFAAADIRVVEITSEARERLKSRFGVAVYEDAAPAVAGAAVVVLAVKPQQLYPVVKQLAPLLDGQLVLSIAAGVRASDISRWLGDYPKVARAMPNTPSMVSAGISGLFAMPGLSEAERREAQSILDAVGMTLWLHDESQMDAVTAVSGSGPAYVFYYMQALQEAAQELGFSSEEARTLALETFVGACKLAADSGEDFALLRAKVTSKGGTTERAILSKEAAGVKAAIIAGVKAAHARSAELAEELGKAE